MGFRVRPREDRRRRFVLDVTPVQIASAGEVQGSFTTLHLCPTARRFVFDLAFDLPRRGRVFVGEAGRNIVGQYASKKTCKYRRSMSRISHAKKTIRRLTMYQFLHISSYSRIGSKMKSGSHSVKTIVNEAVREIHSTPHIENPEAPKYIYGKPLELLGERCEEWANSLQDAAGKKTRKDALCLLAGVMSAPAEIEPAAWEKLRADTVGWLQKKYGDRLHSVIEHTDEANPHLHFYIVPKPGERFDQVHDGKRAAAAIKNESKGSQNKAYIGAMRGLLDDFHSEVGMPNGMLRYGPRRRRLSRDAWKQELEQGRALKKALEGSQAVREAALKDAGKMISDACVKIAEVEAAAVAKGESLGRVEFARRNLLGKVVDMVTGLARDNVTMKSQLSDARDVASGWEAKAEEYYQGFKKFFGIAKKMKPRVQELEIDVNVLSGQVGRLKKDLEREKTNSLRLANDLSATTYKLSSKQQLLDMYEARENKGNKPNFVKSMPLEVESIPLEVYR